MKKTFIVLNILFAIFVVSSVATMPEVLAGDPGTGIENPLGSGTGDVSEFFKIILQKIVIPIGATVVAFFIIWSGFLFVTAGGNEEKISTTRKTFQWTMIGAAILLGSWAISTAIKVTVDAISEISDTP